MNHAEVAKLLTLAKASGDSISGDAAQVSAWLEILGSGMPFDFAKAALIKHYANSNHQVMAADLNGAWRTERQNQRRIDDQKRGPNQSIVNF